MYKLLSFLLVCSSVIFDVSSAQPADGLASTTIVDITQDSHGYIWIGSQDEVTRFDGPNFRHFRPNLEDPNYLSSLENQYLTADKKGGIWITITDTGLNYYDPVVEGFRKYGPENGIPASHRYIEVSIDDINNVLAATENTIINPDRETDHFKREEG